MPPRPDGEGSSCKAPFLSEVCSRNLRSCSKIRAHRTQPAPMAPTVSRSRRSSHPLGFRGVADVGWFTRDKSVYRKIGEEDGVGDRREGEVRAQVEGSHLSVDWEPRDGLPPALRRAMEEHEGSAAETEEMRALFAARDDDPELALQRTGRGEWDMSQNLVVSDDRIPAPYLLCLSREPTTPEEWERLRAELPERYDTWTVTADIDAVRFEIECGIKRWLATERTTRYRIERASDWVAYPFDEAPPSGDPTEVFGMDRWFRKRRKYQAHAEYRLAWSLSSDQRVDMPETIDVPLTPRAQRLFEPWRPPSD